uniref:Uncharacterized protein n=1 Tax=Tetraselmis sp. GSL018 TaxID=582737 RepID=A0A061RMQ2_9CHLO
MNMSLTKNPIKPITTKPSAVLMQILLNSGEEQIWSPSVLRFDEGHNSKSTRRQTCC